MQVWKCNLLRHKNCFWTVLLILPIKTNQTSSCYTKLDRDCSKFFLEIKLKKQKQKVTNIEMNGLL